MIDQPPADAVRAPTTAKPWWRRLWHVTAKALRSVLLLEDTPYRIAMGSAAGIFSSVLPMLGQTFVGMILAKLLRGNVIASLPWSWLSNPATTLPIWYGCYRVGLPLTGGERLSFERIRSIITEFSSLSGTEVFQRGFGVVADMFIPTLVGACLIGALAGALGYLIIHRAVRALHARRERRRQAWAEGMLRTASDAARSPA